MKFFHPPKLYCVTTLPSKTNTTANIGVKCLHVSCNFMLLVRVSRMGKTRVVFIDPGAKVNSSYCCYIVLEEGLLPDIRAICVITGGHCSKMGRQRTLPGPRWTIWKKNTSTSLNLTCGLHADSPDINPVDYAIWGAIQQWVSVSSITVSMNGVDVLKLLSRMAADTSSTATWPEQPHTILIQSKNKFSQ